ncbi:MAG TPA: hypothetical protein VEL76_38410 [Gemmataceae bacterium]|nr:hypothetical protein [Gemmataceae bacterium]
MSTHTPGQELHDRATRGESLSTEERAQLDAWYVQLDHEEGTALAGAAPPGSLTTLRTQIETALGQLATVTQHIQALTAENAAVRQEIAALQRLLAQKPILQPT